MANKLTTATPQSRIAEHVETIRKHEKLATQHVKHATKHFIEVGNELLAVKKLVGHGNWISWLKDEDGKVEEETRKAISPPAWSALQFVADGLGDEPYWYLEPGERTRRDFLAALPADTAIVLLKCVFYDKNWHNESVRKSYAVPATLTISQKSKPSS